MTTPTPPAEITALDQARQVFKDAVASGKDPLGAFKDWVAKDQAARAAASAADRADYERVTGLATTAAQLRSEAARMLTAFPAQLARTSPDFTPEKEQAFVNRANQYAKDCGSDVTVSAYEQFRSLPEPPYHQRSPVSEALLSYPQPRSYTVELDAALNELATS